MTFRVAKGILSVCVAVSLMPGALFAQDTRARVQGLVTDPSQAVVAGATVTLTNDATGVQTATTTNQIGQYIFDFVLPGNYTVTVQLAGFRTFVQRNVLVQSRGDVTVNAQLEVGTVGESVTVDAAPVAVQFNTSTMSLTLDTKMANDLPIIHRNPFLLVSLNPAVVIRSTTEQSPFHHWAASQFDVGGNTNTKNDIILDGAPSMTAQKSSYTPPMDAVQEVNLQQNSVDSEFGHSAGGILSVQMKSGTNEYHGTAYYLGRNPALNAVADSISHRENLTRNHVFGGTLGSPIRKNRLFNFFSYEGWRTIEPRVSQMTLPTEAQRRGDFSQALTATGALRPIFDPWTTRLEGNQVIRQPFAGNIIPQNRIDPLSARVMQDIWQPNGPGTDVSGVNNFIAGYGENIKYWNLSDRVDWNISDKWKVFGRYSLFRTFVDQDDFTGGSPAQPVTGSERHSYTFSGDAVWTINPSTVFNVRGAYNSIVDSFGVPSYKLRESDLAALWPSRWYLPYLEELPDIYYPGITVRALSTATFGRSGYWFQEPSSYNFQGKISRSQGRHYIKVGGEYRKELVVASRPRPMAFDFRPELTANTFLNPNTRESGDAWATFLLGALDQNSSISSIPIQRPRTDYVGIFIHDDLKLTQRLTLNLGLRYEFMTAMRDPQHRLSRFLDLTNPIPEFQGANAPRMPAQVAALRPSAPVYNGAWVFTDSSNPNSWNAQKLLLLPRIGMAYRVNNNTAIRAGFARYIVPPTLTDGLNILGSVPYPGFDATTTTLPLLQGVPQQRFSDPYPFGLVEVVGKRLGRYTNLGGPTTWYQQDFRAGVNDRINVTLQRQLPLSFLLDLTYFANIGRNHPYNIDINQVDPRIGFQVGNVINQQVDNPFFNILPADQFPGQLRTQQRVSIATLLRPFPHYGALTETLIGARRNRYQAVQMQVQRPFTNGFNLVIGYNYNRERNEEFYDNVDEVIRNLTWQPATNARHRITGAGIYQLPFGKGRAYMNQAHPIAQAILGGWAVSGIFTFNTGTFLRFPGALVDGDPTLDNPTRERWFDTSKIRVLPPFTRRQNPLQYPRLTGPSFRNIDLTMAKEFQVTEKISFELRMESYNLTNSFMGANPSTSPTSGTFGQIAAQRPGFFGRQFQYSGRFRW
jgi:hypothetical protein